MIFDQAVHGSRATPEHAGGFPDGEQQRCTNFWKQRLRASLTVAKRIETLARYMRLAFSWPQLSLGGDASIGFAVALELSGRRHSCAFPSRPEL
jgi:hypothetical protein